MSTQEVANIKCKRCKSYRYPKDFLNAKGRELKTCQMCRDRNKKYRENYKCEHNRERSKCKVCGGGSICEHNRERSKCKECGGSSICEHNRQRITCKECGGSCICEHNRVRSKCKECEGGSICEHNRQRTTCKECGVGSICEHNRQRTACKECGGGSICEHNRIRSKCKDCDFNGYLSSIVRTRVYEALKHNKELSSKEYLGCDVETLKNHIENQFTEGMSWDIYGQFHIDHICPIKYKKDGKDPTLEEVIARLHYTNTQPMWASENIAKGNRYIG